MECSSRCHLKLAALLSPVSTVFPESAQRAQHIVVVLFRRLMAAEDPLEKIRVGAVEQRLEAIELSFIEVFQARIGERPEQQITFLGPPMPASEKESPAADVGAVIVQGLIGFALVGHGLPRLFRSDATVPDGHTRKTHGKVEGGAATTCSARLAGSINRQKGSRGEKVSDAVDIARETRVLQAKRLPRCGGDCAVRCF